MKGNKYARAEQAFRLALRHAELADRALVLVREARDLIVERGESMDVPLQFRQHGWLRQANELLSATSKATVLP